ncbi:MAG TPA: serine/threonine-protein kinase, partial [Polyangiales bacterium]|nr:serine/threonine-protein kinase [Polyangiales bacterium]
MAPGTLLADRYRTLATLGHGGSATVYAAHDVRRDAEVALKLLARDADAAQRALFQREYHTLAQITHPGVIRVFEYDSAPEGLLYTMERLDGADLSQLAPMPIARACRVLCEVASALAIVHSRRLLHRDVSHRNVRVSGDGHAKLIDFGAMSPVGFAGDLIGTPPFLAPEIANRERIDQRSDLYALGALAYWLLNGRHLYPAKTVRQLRKLWQSTPAPSFAPDTPPALQQLIAALLQRDARLRPGSAAEVIDRLSALAGISADQSPSVARAYLDHPKLIGRGAELGSVRGLLDRAGTGQASAMLVLGAQGTGKSRVLEELVMHARFAGLSVLQVSAHAAERKSNGLLMLLFAELQRELPNVFAAVSALRTPSVPPAGAATSVTGPELQARAQAEWLTLFGAAATRERLLLVVDDAHLADDESLITLGALAALAPRGPSILLSARDRSHEGVRRFSARAEKLVKLRALSADETAQLVDSLFSGSPVGTRMATFMHEHTRGNPLQCI